MKKYFIPLICALLLLQINILAEEIKPFSGKSYIVPYIKTPPKIDGVFEPGEWDNSLVIDKMYQIEPGDNTEPTDKTIFHICYDSKNIYIGIIASIKKVDKFQAIHISRDGSANTEFVQVLFDTFVHYTEAYSIIFNPYGEIKDGIFQGHYTNTSQDFEIFSKGKVYNDKYIIEAKIPFRNFKFNNKPPIKWGFLLSRIIQMKSGEENDLSVKINRDNPKMLQFEDYLIFEHKINTRGAYIIPEILLSYNKEDYTSTFDPSFSNSFYKGNIGLTSFLKLNSGTRLGIAVNPDFSEIEADDIHFDVNHRFPIYYSEKRPFFLESSEDFSVMGNLFYSRSIVDPDLGMKFISKWGKNTFSSLYAIERNMPGERFGLSGDIIDNVQWYLTRYKYNFKDDSYLGVFSITRKFANSTNTVFDVDGNYRINEKSNVEFMSVITKDTGITLNDNRNPLGGRWSLEYIYKSRYFNFWLHTFGITDDYINDGGFTWRTNYWEYSYDYEFHYEAKSDKEWLRAVKQHGEFHIGHDFQGNLSERRYGAEYEMDIKGGNGFHTGWEHMYELFADKGFNYSNYNIFYSNRYLKWLYVNIGYLWGEKPFYSFSYPQLGDFHTIRGWFALYPTNKFSITGNVMYSIMDGVLSGDKLYGYFSSELKGKYQYTKNNYTRLQYIYSHYNYPIYEIEENNHFIQIVQVYNPRDYTALYVGFLYGRDKYNEYIYDRSLDKRYKFFVKIDYKFDKDF